MKSKAAAMLREARNMPAIVSSFTALALAPGVLNTGMPRFEYASTGILFTPLPARPTASTVSGIGKPCRSKERSRMASGWGHSRADRIFFPRQPLETVRGNAVIGHYIEHRISPIFSRIRA